MIALREILRRRVQFGLISLIVGLIVFLVVMISALGTGLMSAMSGAVRAWPADVIVFSASSNRSFLRSELTADAVGRVASAPGVESVARVGYLPATIEGPTGDLTDATLFGVDAAALGLADAAGPGPNEILADHTFLRESGLNVGDRVVLRNALRRFDLTIAGEVHRGQFLGLPTVYASMETWRSIRYANNPTPPDASVALVQVAPGSLAAAVDAIDVDADLTALSKDAAINAIGGVKQQNQVVQTIELFGFVIGALVIGIFFYVLTMQKTGQIAIFKAIGASNLYVFRQLVEQVLLVTAIGVAFGVPLAVLASAAIPEQVPLELTARDVITGVAGILVTGLIGSLFSGRHVVGVDPMTALGQSQ